MGWRERPHNATLLTYRQQVWHDHPNANAAAGEVAEPVDASATPNDDAHPIHSIATPGPLGGYPVSELSNALRCARTALIAAIRRGLNLRRSPAGGGASGPRHCRCLVAVGRLPPPSQSRYSVPTGGPRQTSRQGSYPPILPSPLRSSARGRPKGQEPSPDADARCVRNVLTAGLRVEEARIAP